MGTLESMNFTGAGMTYVSGHIDIASNAITHEGAS